MEWNGDDAWIRRPHPKDFVARGKSASSLVMNYGPENPTASHMATGPRARSPSRPGVRDYHEVDEGRLKDWPVCWHRDTEAD